jgi:hypothetical protein
VRLVGIAELERDASQALVGAAGVRVARLLSIEGSNVGVSYAPWLHK